MIERTKLERVHSGSKWVGNNLKEIWGLHKQNMDLVLKSKSKHITLQHGYIVQRNHGMSYQKNGLDILKH